MRILWVKTELLHPIDKGGKIRTYEMLRALAREHDVTYLCLDDGTAAPDALERSREYAQRAQTVAFRQPKKLSPAFFLDLLRNLFSRLPYAAAKYVSPMLRGRIVELAGAADVVICDFLFPSPNFPDEVARRAVLFQHNVEALIWERHAANSASLLRRLYMGEQWRRMKRFEREQCGRFAHVVAVSEKDAALMEADYGLRGVTHVRTGVDLAFFRAPSEGQRGTREIVFVGSMDWLPNEDGIVWFASEVMPLVTARVPDATLTIVGRKPSPAVQRLAQTGSGINVTGSVPDVRPYLHRAALSVVPLRIGGGTRLKIYEAMAAGTPVVSTTIGAEGLPLEDGTHIRLADEATTMADAIVSLLDSPTQSAQLAQAALRFVEEHAGWDAVAADFIGQCLRGSAGGGSG